ncbi:hypothetical protein SARC_09557 [Sphaeroforma arctica JP610]|uniref:Uncharacterized protein n=1 Tax=Sphaeroforma arctica JP610 TaxID=667725 RepID=A0A0L0FND8_9EUKA|nr:hypothetical protein SARC_09557 [Sphaeroforma arctica JP610]KNC77996.1 hypothetical protein SARC_09557 [Sphaeroforma arctica JP610]|eukprot:XP_014151898.1 hypothetical protein SARC_09557 [Sphaeroforma arctica JP610]
MDLRPRGYTMLSAFTFRSLPEVGSRSRSPTGRMTLTMRMTLKESGRVGGLHHIVDPKEGMLLPKGWGMYDSLDASPGGREKAVRSLGPTIPPGT